MPSGDTRRCQVMGLWPKPASLENARGCMNTDALHALITGVASCATWFAPRHGDLATATGGTASVPPAGARRRTRRHLQGTESTSTLSSRRFHQACPPCPPCRARGSPRSSNTGREVIRIMIWRPSLRRCVRGMPMRWWSCWMRGGCMHGTKMSVVARGGMAGHGCIR